MKNYGGWKDNLYPTTAQVLCPLSMFDLLGTCRLSESCRLAIDNDRFDKLPSMCGPIDRSSCPAACPAIRSDRHLFFFFFVSYIVFFNVCFLQGFFLSIFLRWSCHKFYALNFPLTIRFVSIRFNSIYALPVRPIDWHQLSGILDLLISPAVHVRWHWLHPVEHTFFDHFWGSVQMWGILCDLCNTSKITPPPPTNSVWHAAHKALLWRFKVFHIAIIVNQQPANCSSGPRHKQTNYNHN